MTFFPLNIAFLLDLRLILLFIGSVRMMPQHSQRIQCNAALMVFPTCSHVLSCAVMLHTNGFMGLDVTVRTCGVQ